MSNIKQTPNYPNFTAAKVTHAAAVAASGASSTAAKNAAKDVVTQLQTCAHEASIQLPF